MFIRQTKTRSSDSGADYFTYRIVESSRVGKKVSQHTLLNLGSNFNLQKEAWPELCTRISELLKSEEPLFEVDAAIEQSAQHLYTQILARRGDLQALEEKKSKDYQEVDVNSIKQIKPRTVGAEHVSLEALKELGVPERVGLSDTLKYLTTMSPKAIRWKIRRSTQQNQRRPTQAALHQKTARNLI